ncbi:hypothetical protein [Arthrobacter sp. UYEF20]|uniref:hypothetical protein n=1 Tax=Arthrobacter sp. UYEF20 TaxID=1756363 RepID=UPI00339746C4
MPKTDQQPWVKNYQPGVPAEIELPMESLVAKLEQSVAEAGSALAGTTRRKPRRPSPLMAGCAPATS